MTDCVVIKRLEQAGREGAAERVFYLSHSWIFYPCTLLPETHEEGE